MLCARGVQELVFRQASPPLHEPPRIPLQVNGSDNLSDESDDFSTEINLSTEEWSLPSKSSNASAAQEQEEDQSDNLSLEINRSTEESALSNKSSNASAAREQEELEEVRLMLRVATFNYGALAAKPQLLADLKAAVALQVARVAGVALERITVHAWEGSLQLSVVIQASLGSVSQVRGSLISATDAGDLASDLAAYFSSVPGVSDVVDGPITVDVQSVDMVHFEANSSNHTESLPSRSAVLADNIAFNLTLVGGTWLLCYRFADGNASMAFGELQVLGAGLLRNGAGGALEPVVNHVFDLEVIAPLGGLLFEDRVMLIDSFESCGSSSGTLYLNNSLDVPGIPGSTADSNTSLQWADLVISKPGIFAACWCWSGSMPCTSDAGYSLLLDTVLVRGPVSFTPHEVPAGHSFRLVLDGFGLTAFDNVRLANLSATCGSVALEHAPQLRGSAESSTGDSSLRQWSSLMLMEPGTYILCWCAGSSMDTCSGGQSFDFSLGFLDVWGPVISSHRCAVGSACSVILSGVPSYKSSSILLRKGDVECEGSDSAPVSMKGLTNPQQSQITGSDFFTRFRFTPVRARSGSMVQLSELLFYFDGSPVDLPAVVAQRLPGGAGPEAEGPAYAVDGRRATKYLDLHGIGFEITLADARQVDAVSYVTANDAPERDPVAFMLEGFSDRPGRRQ